MKGRILQEEGKMEEAYKEYMKALEMSEKKDCYARAGIANIHY